MQTTPNNSKRQRGRPSSGRSPIVSLALPAPLLVRIDTSADHEFESRASAIRRLLTAGLACEGKADATTPVARPAVKRASDARRLS